MDTKLSTIAEVYARSLLELASARGAAASIDQEFAEFAAYLKIDLDFRAFFTSRIVDADERRKTLDKIFQNHMSDLLLNTLQILNAKDRTEIVGEMQRLYHRQFQELEGIVDVQVATAEPLSDALRQRVQQMMEARTGKRVSLVEQVEPSMLGGLIVRVGDECVDASIAHQLQRFHGALVDHATRHIHAGSDFFEEAERY